MTEKELKLPWEEEKAKYRWDNTKYKEVRSNNGEIIHVLIGIERLVKEAWEPYPSIIRHGSKEKVEYTGAIIVRDNNVLLIKSPNSLPDNLLYENAKSANILVEERN
ncbi:MAG: hypothetical protein AABW79_00835 [Nanoarchaeota archaeon]